jgi:hypothetical protein
MGTRTRRIEVRTAGRAIVRARGEYLHHIGRRLHPKLTQSGHIHLTRLTGRTAAHTTKALSVRRLGDLPNLQAVQLFHIAATVVVVVGGVEFVCARL